MPTFSAASEGRIDAQMSASRSKASPQAKTPATEVAFISSVLMNRPVGPSARSQPSWLAIGLEISVAVAVEAVQRDATSRPPARRDIDRIAFQRAYPLVLDCDATRGSSGLLVRWLEAVKEECRRARVGASAHGASRLPRRPARRCDRRQAGSPWQ